MDENLISALERKSLGALACCVRGYTLREEKTTFELDPMGEKQIKSLVVTRKKVAPDLDAIRFVLTNLNPQTWSVKPTVVPAAESDEEEELDLSSLSDEALELLRTLSTNPEHGKEEENLSTSRHTRVGAALDDPLCAHHHADTRPNTLSQNLLPHSGRLCAGTPSPVDYLRAASTRKVTRFVDSLAGLRAGAAPGVQNCHRIVQPIPSGTLQPTGAAADGRSDLPESIPPLATQE